MTDRKVKGDTNLLKDIIDNNSYPIVFIGSGMSKRYLKDFPTWLDLLEEYWKLLGEEKSIFSYMRELKKELEDSVSDNEKDFAVNTKTASYIKQKYDDLFFDGVIKIDGLDQSTAFHNSISPFNFSLAERFKNPVIKDEMREEIDLYTKFLSKAKVIITTNYDTLTEDLLYSINKKPTVYVGQKGFFDETRNWSELFKIHGDVNDPNSIIITEEDYRKYDKNSILISAKILANLINSPIIFLGYSLTDRNIQKLLSDFSSQLPNDDLRKTSNRITVVDYQEGQNEFTEQIVNNPSINISHSIIKTDNYSELYREIIKIDQGLSPYEVSLFESKIKNIIVTAGANGKLSSVLVAPRDLETMPEDVQNKHLVCLFYPSDAADELHFCERAAA
ncbi:SIR2 family protein, partial [Streptococcus sp. TATVAM-FAB21]|uniref:SIR2 family protein n=1 Tax=Streptococcus sp. TATVAM-FAB21 TaxID=3093698 RepID=UPI003980BD29